ncbi:VanZ family protein [Gottfriedia sp. NPDC057948]|uniref:VanZ family protein n=1 Tax=Gottfriedia sp. NPDC057948 TaxID=3346287 RepID=UPI0036DF59D1
MLRMKPIFFIIAGIIFFIYQVIKLLRKKEVNILKVLMTFIFMNYVLFIIFILFFPIFIDPHALEKGQSISYNIIPFKSLYETTVFCIKHGYYSTLIKNIIGNLILIMPISFYLKILWNKLKDWRIVLILSFLISIFIELTQLIENIFQGTGRSVDIDDVILNVTGFILGYWLATKLYSQTTDLLLGSKKIEIRKNQSKTI